MFSRYVAKPIVITNAGGTLNLDDIGTLYDDFILINGTFTLAAGYAITVSTPPNKPTTYNILYDGRGTTSDTNFVSIFGRALSREQALKGMLWIKCVWNMTASAWIVSIMNGFPDIANEKTQVTDMNMAGQTYSITQNSPTYQWMRTGGGTLTGNVTVSTTGSFSDATPFIYKHTGGFDPGTFTYIVFGLTIPREVCLSGDFTVNSFYVTGVGFVAQLTSNGSTEEVFVIPVSFENLEQCNNKFIAPYDGVLTFVDSFVTKALSAADTGNITVKINGTPVNGGGVTMSIPLSSILDVQTSATITSTNVFLKGDIISIAGAKATVGGKVLVSLRHLATPQ